MANRTWTFTVGDERHTVELEHGTISGKRVIRVDGTTVAEARKLIDTGSKHPFTLDGYAGLVRISTDGVTFDYSLQIDGRTIRDGDHLPTRNELTAMAAAGVPSQAVPGGDGARAAAGLTYALMKREIRGWSLWALVMGAIHVLGTGFLNAPWGVTLLLVGAASLLFVDAAMFVVYGTTMAWAGICNLSSGSGHWILAAVVQFILAARVFQQFTRFRRAQHEILALTGEGTPLEPRARRAAILFPWLAAILGVTSLAGMQLFFVGLLLDGAENLPTLAYTLAEIASYLGVVGFAVGLGSLLSGHRDRVGAMLGMATSAIVVVGVLGLMALPWVA